MDEVEEDKDVIEIDWDNDVIRLNGKEEMNFGDLWIPEGFVCIKAFAKKLIDEVVDRKEKETMEELKKEGEEARKSLRDGKWPSMQDSGSSDRKKEEMEYGKE